MRATVEAYLDNIIARFDNAPARLRSTVTEVMEDVADYLWGMVRQRLSGDVLQLRTGRLYESIQKQVNINGDIIIARIFSDGSAPYSRIQDLGGTTRPHDIVARRASVLRFEIGGGLFFRREVHHPGSKIPASMYMRGVLISERARVLQMIKSRVKASI